ncbi:IST1 homolog isoform X3 [Eriocheir sinensis]|uniref:IST1 homolog isoform X3 n=1 Tax=Eriocheir sinensis TaxID=95602 RepID=UPI0021C88B7D|nr:IST1 homolog isoform X3 [Eriocheir sinensis]
MFSSGPNYTKLKTNLRLSINRLKLLEKKKTELAQKARKEIADYLSTGKTERAKIRVEHIIREDYLVEAMEVTEMYCDLLLARYGLIQQMKDLDEGMAEAVSSLIWAAPRLQTDVAELKIIADQLTLKFGKPYGQACREQQVTTISERLIHKLSVQAPPKVLVEKYLVEIAKNYNVEYEPDPQVMREDEWGNDPLISLDEKNNLGNGGAGGGGGGGGGMNIPPMAGFIGYPPQPMPQQPFTYPGSVLHPTPIPHEAPALPSKHPLPEPQPPLGPPWSPASLCPSPQDSRIQAGPGVPSILLTNPQSLTNCFDEFKEVVAQHNPDVIVVSETWFSEARPAAQHNLSGYRLFHDDREGRGGGVAVYARESLQPQEVKLKAPPELECVWVAVDGGAVVCGLYHAPRAPTGPALMDQIVNSVVDIRTRNPSAVFAVAGDFNNLPYGRLCACLGLTNLVQEPTHLNSIIDLVLTDAPNAFERPSLLPPIGRSKHSCVLVTPMPIQECQGGAGAMDLNLPNVPGQPIHPQPGMPMGGYNIPPGGPPPADASADPLPEKISNMQDGEQPKPAPRSKFGEGDAEFTMPDLPSVPDLPGTATLPDPSDAKDDIDFDDLTKRFEDLKKKK